MSEQWEDEDWFHELPTLELPVVQPEEVFNPVLPPLRLLHAEPEVTSWQAVRETGSELHEQLGKFVALTFRVLAWVLDALRPLLPFGVLVLLLAGLLSLVPSSLGEKAEAWSRQLGATTSTTEAPRRTTTTEYYEPPTTEYYDSPTTSYYDPPPTESGPVPPTSYYDPEPTGGEPVRVVRP